MQIEIKRGRPDRKQEADSLFIYANIYAVATVCVFVCIQSEISTSKSFGYCATTALQ